MAARRRKQGRPSFGTGKPPTVSDTPPFAPASLPVASRAKSPRCLALYGPPKSGVKTAAYILGASFPSAVFVESEEDAADVLRSKRWPILALPRSSDLASSMQRLFNARLVYGREGSIVELIVTYRDCLLRGARPSELDTYAEITLPPAEEQWRTLNLPRAGVPNESGEEGLERCIVRLAQIARLC